MDFVYSPDEYALLNVKKTNDGKYITTGKNRAFVITKTASTLNRAVSNLYEDLSEENLAWKKEKRRIR